LVLPDVLKIIGFSRLDQPLVIMRIAGGSIALVAAYHTGNSRNLGFAIVQEVEAFLTH
jgi:hypothetical protein